MLWDLFENSGMSVVAIDAAEDKVVGATTVWDAATIHNWGCCKICHFLCCVYTVPADLQPMVSIAEEVQSKLPEVY